MYKKIVLSLIISILVIGVIYALSYKIILLLALPIIASFIYIISRNAKVMHKTIEEGMKIIQNKYSIKQLDIGDFKQMTIYGIISFYTKAYNIEGLGILSIMTVNLGVMQMFTFSINPYEKDLPQMSNDIIYMFNKRIFRIEFYNLMIDSQNSEYKSFINKIKEINNKYSYFEDVEIKKNWYLDLLSALISKKDGTKYEQKFIELFIEVMKLYIEYSNNIKKLNNDNIIKKIALIEEFGNNLIDKGGISTDQFKKNFGIDKTRKYFGNVLFGYDIYKDMITK
jgi:hypothetical protein